MYRHTRKIDVGLTSSLYPALSDSFATKNLGALTCCLKKKIKTVLIIMIKRKITPDSLDKIERANNRMVDTITNDLFFMR